DNGEDYEAVARIDRLNGSYSSGPFLAKLGRQAITWGNGLAFQTMDLFDPFSPAAIDKENKTGENMALVQAKLRDNKEDQILFLRRRDIGSHDLEYTESSSGAKFHGRVESVDYDLMAARHYNDSVFGVGASRDIFEGVFRADLTFTDLDTGEEALSTVMNYD